MTPRAPGRRNGSPGVPPMPEEEHVSDTAQKLAEARQRAEKAQARLDAAEGRVGAPTRDPGVLSGIKVRNPGRHAQKQSVAWRRALDAYREAAEAHGEVARLENRLSREQREAEANAAATVDLSALKPGDLIRYRSHGSSLGNWLRVKRVNKTTVTCDESEPGMDAPRIPHDRIVETRHQESA